MFSADGSILAAVQTVENIATIRLISMLGVLAGGLFFGYLASNKFGMPEDYAKKIMTAVVLVFNWPVALFVIWNLKLETSLIWLPVSGVALMLSVTALSVPISLMLRLDKKSRITFLLASCLSNLGYTGGAFVCYALFGATALAMANLYVVLWLPTAYFIFFPLVKIIELRQYDSQSRFKMGHIFDLRYIVLPAILVALILNIGGIKRPEFIKDFYIVDFFIYTASSLSFFAIGLRVKISRFKNYMSLYFPLAAVKFIITPIVALLIIYILAITGHRLNDLVRNVIIVMAVTPSAVIMVMMSNVFDLDSRMASALWVVNTAFFALVVVPILFFIFN
jgi:predicted permease